MENQDVEDAETEAPGREESQQIFFKLTMFEQTIRNLQQQLQAVEESLSDLNNLNAGLDEIKGSVGKEVLAPLGRGIFVETKLISDSLTVDVGGKTFVKKTVPETKEIIETQVKKLKEIGSELNEKIEEVSEEINKTISETQENELS